MLIRVTRELSWKAKIEKERKIFKKCHRNSLDQSERDQPNPDMNRANQSRETLRRKWKMTEPESYSTPVQGFLSELNEIFAAFMDLEDEKGIKGWEDGRTTIGLLV